MKSLKCSRRLISLALLSGAVLMSDACGPYNPIIPTPEFFAHSSRSKSMRDYERDENLRLWQSMTDSRIPLWEIEDAVYRTNSDELSELTYSKPENPKNLFFRYLNNTNDSETREFLYAAKLIEEEWGKTRSPWYYPQSRVDEDGIGDFQPLIDKCKSYTGSRLKDRYALQLVRILFASRRYAACVEYYDSAFSAIPDGNLMKRMALRYAAGCRSRLGDTQMADSMFAAVGDVWSVSVKDRVAYMAEHNPDAPQLMEYIRDNVRDTAFMRSTAAIAGKLVRDSRVTHPGDWNFLMAYVNNEYNRDCKLARKQMRQAMMQQFSTPALASLAHAYKMKLDAQANDMSDLLKDMNWMAGKIDPLASDANEWIRRVRNIIYADWVPRLWKKKDYATAVLLCAYADNIASSNVMIDIWDAAGWTADPMPRSMTIDQMRVDYQFENKEDYSCLSFQLMGSLNSSQLEDVYGRIMSDTPLYNFLRQDIRTDSDYYNELIGTLALREEDYDRAVTFLSKVSHRYQRTMNIYKCGYLARDPFVAYPTRWEKYRYFEDDTPLEYEHQAAGHNDKRHQLDAKLDFAKRMSALKNIMRKGKTPDERGMARLEYAIGRRNSFEECWALTQYWRGNAEIFYPVLYYSDVDFADTHYRFLYEYEHVVGHRNTEALYDKEVKASMAMLESDEAKARVEYIFGNVRTVVKRFPDTATAEHVRTSCDNWKSWL